MIGLAFLSARPHSILNCIQKVFDTCGDRAVICLGYSGQKIDIPEDSRLHVEYYGEQDPEGFTPALLLNQLTRTCVSYFKLDNDDLVGCWCDDYDPQPGWLEALIQTYDQDKSKSYIAVNDGSFSPGYVRTPWYHAPLFFCSVSYLCDIKDWKLLDECFSRFFCDSDNAIQAKVLKRFAFSENSHIRHLHPTNNGREKDELDIKSEQFIGSDYIQFQARRAMWQELVVPSHFRTNEHGWEKTELAQTLSLFCHEFKPSNIIITGTGTGLGATRFLAKLFPRIPIATIECLEHYHIDSRNILKHFSNVTAVWGHSLTYSQHENAIVNGTPEDTGKFICLQEFKAPENTLQCLIDSSERPLLFLDSSPVVITLEKMFAINYCKQNSKSCAIVEIDRNGKPNIGVQ
jgi:hypothetical protein